MAYGAAAQDLIVKKSGEVIYCNIESVEDYYVQFYELADTSKSLLYKMDVAIVKKIAFAGNNELPFEDENNFTADKDLNGSYTMVETNVDGLLSDYASLHFQFLRSKYAIDIGFKRFSSPSNFFFGSFEDNGSMVELGVSLPMKIFGNENRPLRGLYLRAFTIYTAGNFTNNSQFGGSIVEYNQISLGVQGVLHYQIASSFYLKVYYGLGGTIQVDSFGPPVRRADLSGGDGLQSIYGVRIGYIF